MEMLFLVVGFGFATALFFLIRGDGKLSRYIQYRHKHRIGFWKGLRHYSEWKRRDNEEYTVYIENGFGYSDIKRTFSVALLIDGNGVRYSRIINGRDDDEYHRDAKAYRYAWAKLGISTYKPRMSAATKPDMLDPVKTALAFLGLKSSVTVEEVNTAYRKLAMKYHPDHGGSVADFVKLGKAKEVVLANIAMKRK